MEAMGDTSGEAALALQDRFDTRRLADRLRERFRAAWTLDGVRGFVESGARCFLATVDGVLPNCPRDLGRLDVPPASDG